MLPLGGIAWIGQTPQAATTAVGLIVPPELTHACAATSAYVALFIDPTLIRPGPGVVPLDRPAVSRLHAALGSDVINGPRATPDLAAAYDELLTLTGAAPSLDARVTHAVRQSMLPRRDALIHTIAAEVGLSAPRLRTLVRASLGVPLARLRQWGRLREAIAGLPNRSVAAAAADAGFADQAHLTRTARTLLGRTPISLTRAPADSRR
ncbi:helix-turn-helix domain-containing protein [Nonomuraea sp. B5E05]|uniref:helix-turn-helix domain-containing protein n=1 Tax=Nonomuraea sp. B5E05 TaxID=3153569 RepID=UPI0032613593